MTKRELIHALEPFDDDIPVVIAGFSGQVYHLVYPFYALENGDGKIIISRPGHYLPKGTKAIQLIK